VLGFASGVALADDSSMNPFTGDSYAYFNGLDYRLNGFNTPRPQAGGGNRADRMPVQPRAGVASPMPRHRGEVADPGRDAVPGKLDGRVLLAAPHSPRTLQNPFRDDTGA
jgi:hypothetical protein